MDPERSNIIDPDGAFADEIAKRHAEKLSQSIMKPDEIGSPPLGGHGLSPPAEMHGALGILTTS